MRSKPKAARRVIQTPIITQTQDNDPFPLLSTSQSPPIPIAEAIIIALRKYR